jgi:hypothetical protein
MAPLSVREAEQATGLQVLGEAELTEPGRVTQRVFARVPAVTHAPTARGPASVAAHA